MATRTQMTAREFLNLPESMLPTQLINGEVMMSPAPELYHQQIVGYVHIILQAIVPGGQVYLAPVDVYLDDVNIVQPDVLWISPGSACVPVEGKHLRGAPDLVVEVLSPGTARLDRREKFRLYQRFGVREYWIIDPIEKLLEIWQLKDGQFVRIDAFGVGDACHSPLLGEVVVKTIFGE